MNNEMNIELSIKDTEIWKEFCTNLKDLMHQIEIAEFEDENGAIFKNNIAYINMKETIGKYVE